MRQPYANGYPAPAGAVGAAVSCADAGAVMVQRGTRQGQKRLMVVAGGVQASSNAFNHV